MSSQRLEGSDLEALLARVRSEHGGTATIVEANKVRRGGVGGFFAKESFEVVVDIPDDVGAVRPDAHRSPAAPPVDDPRLDELHRDDLHCDEDGDRAGDDDDEPFVAFSLDELAGRVDDPAPTFSEVLGKAIAAERAAALEPAWPAATALAEAAKVPSHAVPRFEPGTRQGQLLTGATAPSSGGLSAADLRALARLGLPTERAGLLARSDDPAAVALVRLLEGFPAAPAIPRSANAVVAVLGDRADALALASTIAGDPSRVVVAGRHRGADLRHPGDVVDLRRSWRRRHGVVVALEAPFGIEPAPEVAAMLDALLPSLVLGHVDAGRKPEDVAAWSAAVGGLDAVALTGIDRTTTPAAVLATGIPVATIDGQPATASRWAALLTDRLTASLAA